MLRALNGRWAREARFNNIGKREGSSIGRAAPIELPPLCFPFLHQAESCNWLPPTARDLDKRPSGSSRNAVRVLSDLQFLDPQGASEVETARGSFSITARGRCRGEPK